MEHDMNKEIIEVQALAHYMAHLLIRRYFGDVSFERIQEKTNISKDRAVEILNIFDLEHLIDFSFAPWEPGKHDMNYYSPEVLKTGYFNHVSKELKEQERERDHERLMLYKNIHTNYEPVPKIKSRIKQLKEIAASEATALKLIQSFRIKSKKTSSEKILSISELKFNQETGEIIHKKGKDRLPLDGQVYKALQLLLIKENNVATYQELVQTIFNTTELSITKMNLIYKIISNLNKKVKPVSVINTGVGYMLKA
jgi:hypothetical protein